MHGSGNKMYIHLVYRLCANLHSWNQSNLVYIKICQMTLAHFFAVAFEIDFHLHLMPDHPCLPLVLVFLVLAHHLCVRCCADHSEVTTAIPQLSSSVADKQNHCRESVQVSRQAAHHTTV